MDRRQLASRLKAACSLTGNFVLRSGEVSDFYFDKYLFEAVPELLRAVAEHASPLVPESTEILAGLELGGRAHFHSVIPADGAPASARPQRSEAVRHGQTGGGA